MIARLLVLYCLIAWLVWYFILADRLIQTLADRVRDRWMLHQLRKHFPSATMDEINALRDGMTHDED